MLKPGDNIAIERKTGFTTVGIFIEQDEDFITVTGSVGSRIDQQILVPHQNVDQICILSPAQ